MSCFKRLALYLVACFAVSSSVSAADLPSGPVQIEPSIPYPEKMTFIGLSESIALGASMGLEASVATRGAVKEYIHKAASQRRNLTPVAVFVREEFSDAIRDQGFVPQDDSSIENRFRLSARKYGFGMAELVSRQGRQLVTLYAELVTPANKSLSSNDPADNTPHNTCPAF